MGRFLNVLKVAPYADGKCWCVLEDFQYQDEAGSIVTVPAGFITDFASIPRMFWDLLPPWGKYGFAAVIHDWLYYDQSVPKTYADDCLLQGMKALNVSAIAQSIIFEAVSKAGEVAWETNTRKKALGFIRVAPELPKSIMDLPFTWAGTTGDWKKG